MSQKLKTSQDKIIKALRAGATMQIVQLCVVLLLVLRRFIFRIEFMCITEEDVGERVKLFVLSV